MSRTLPLQVIPDQQQQMTTTIVEQQIMTRNVVYVYTLEENDGQTFKVVLYTYSNGSKPYDHILCYLEKEGGGQDTGNTKCLEFNYQAIEWIDDPTSIWSSKNPNDEFFFDRMRSKDWIRFCTYRAEPMHEDLYKRIDELEIELLDFKGFLMSRKAFRALCELAPTLKFIMKSFNTRAKIPTIQSCMYALVEIEYGELDKPCEDYESSLEKWNEQIKPTVIENMKLFQRTLSLPQNLVDLCFKELYSTEYIAFQKMTPNFKQIMKFIMENEVKGGT